MFARTLCSTLALVLAALGCGVAAAQDDPPPLKPEELDALTAPIALYPDSLLAQLLMATTYPADVALAADWSAAHKDNTGDDAIKMVEGEPWDPSVKSLVAFPQILAMMKEQPDWVQKIGDAFLAQSKDVMDSVQRLRKQAKEAGNLKSTDEQVVKEEPAAASTDATTTTSTSTETTIIIEPADPEVVYVPNYDTTVVYGSWGYSSYPPYYFPPPPGYYWGSSIMAGLGFAAGIAIIDGIWGDCNWGGGDIDIDIDRYNNINVGNEIGSGNRKWEHNAANRDGVPYRDSASREKYANNSNRATASQRSDYRGRDTSASATTRDGSAAATREGQREAASTRDAQREAARGNLERSTGVSTRDAGAAAGQINRDLANQGVSAGDLARDSSRDLSGGRSSASAGTRDLGGAGVSSRDVSGARASAGTSSRDYSGSASRASAGTSSRDYSSGGSRSSYSGGSRDSAFSGASSPSHSRQSVSRGSSSAGGRSFSGGGGGRAGGGGGRRR